MLADPAEGGRNEFHPEAAGAAARRGAVAEAGTAPDAVPAVPGPAVAPGAGGYAMVLRIILAGGSLRDDRTRCENARSAAGALRSH